MSFPLQSPRWNRRSGGALPWVLALAVLVALVGGVLSMRDATPTLDETILETSYLSWREKPLLDYDMTLSVAIDGLDQQRPSVSVRGGKLVAQRLNEQTRESGDDSYTIEGLFRTLQRELDFAKEPDGRGAAGHTVIRARFDETHGVPVLFKRLTSRQGARSFVVRVESLVGPNEQVIYSSSNGS